MHPWSGSMGWAPACVCSQLVAHGLTHLSGGWYQLTSAGGTEMIWPRVSYPPANRTGFTTNLVLLSGFPRAARGQSPKCTSTFGSSACVIFAIIVLVKASHKTKPSNGVGVAWVRAQRARDLRALFGKSRQHEIQETVEWGKGIPPGYLHPTLSAKSVCIHRGVSQSCFQGVARLGPNVQRK